MRILFVVHGFPPVSMGGTEIYTHDLARALQAGGTDEVFVFTREADSARLEYAVRSETQNGVHITFANNTFRACRSFEDGYRNPSIREIGAALLDRIRPDVVHVQHITCLSTDLLTELADRSIPVVYTLNDYWLICHRGQLLDVNYERCNGPYPDGCGVCTSTGEESQRDSAARLRHMRDVCERVDHFLAPSRTLHERFTQFGIEAERMTLQQQGIDQSGFVGLRRTASSHLRIAFMGSLIVSKAPHVLLDAFEGLPPGSASLHLFGSIGAYHGDDGYRQTIAVALARGGHTCVQVPHDRIPEVLSGVDVVVVPSVWIENAPFVIREAFAGRVPVVASNIGGMAEMVTDGTSGLLFDPGNAADLRRCLKRLIDEPDLLNRLRRGIPAVKTIEEDAAWTRAIYEKVIAGRAGRGGPVSLPIQEGHVGATKPLRTSAPEAGGRFSWLVLLACLLIAAGAFVCARSVATERGFPYWDFAWYEEQVLATADLARNSVTDAASAIRWSLGQDYTLLYTAPLVPWALVFGETRLSYILGVYFLFFLPYLLLAAVIARRAAPSSRHAGMVAMAAVLLTPACWSHVLQGYPDIGGAAMLLACILLYGLWAERRLGLSAPIMIGALAALSVLFRRHYVYGVAALYGGMALDRAFTAAAGIDRESMGTSLRRGFIGLALSAFVMIGAIGLAAPDFLDRALANQSQFAAYQETVGGVLVSMIATVGLAPLALALAGWVAWRRDPGLNQPELRLIAAATLLWILVWAVHSRQQPYHYPHWLPLFVVLGLVLLWSALTRSPRRLSRIALQAAVVAVLLAGWAYSMPALESSRPPTLPFRVLPDVIQRSTNPAYDSIAGLVSLLRNVAAPDDEIVVAAASPTINPDIVRSAERTLFGRKNARLNIVRNAQIDDGVSVPTEHLLHAQFVVVARPPQHLRGPEYHKVVLVLVEAFDAGWPVSNDFEPFGQRFPLPGNGEVTVYRRRAPTSDAVALDTSRRIDQVVLGRTFSDGVWTVDSIFPSVITRSPAGNVRLQVHPARTSDARPTLVRLAGFAEEAARITGHVVFLDDRCRGVEVTAVVGRDVTDETSLGSFSPGNAITALDRAMPGLGRQPVALKVQGLPSDRDNIDYCTVTLDDVAVSALR